MKIKLNKQRFAHFLTYELFPFLILGSVATFGLYYAVESIDELKDYEKIDLFGEAYGFVGEDLKEHILASEKGTIFQVNTHFYSPKMREISSMYQAYGVYADILLLTEKDLKDMASAITKSFLPLNEEFSLHCSIPSLLTTYSYEGIPYAVKVYDVEDEEYSSHYRLGDIVNYDKDFSSLYLLLNSKSENMGPLNGISKNEAGLHVFSYLMERYYNV